MDSEERITAGHAVMSVLDVMEDPEVYEAYAEARKAIERAVSLVRDKGVPDRHIMLGMLGLVFGPVLPDE